MKFPDFRYRRPVTLAEALTALDEEGEAGQMLAGGQTLMPLLALRMAAPDCLIDLNWIAELGGVMVVEDRLRIGAMTRYVELEASDLIALHAPLIARALPFVAHVAIRNRGTIGGSTVLADPAAEIPACLLAMAAELELVSQRGTRRVPADDFFVGLYDTARTEDEILTAILLPLGSRVRIGFYEIARRHGDYALAGAAAFEGVNGLRVAIFGCDDRPVLAKSAACAVMAGEDVRVAAELLSNDVKSTDNLQGDAATRLTQAKVAFRRAIENLREANDGADC
jgi:carbon-monoxide dehydrogenase medium subunit